jgi:hypothetical protein
VSLGGNGGVVNGDVGGLNEGAVHEGVGAAATPTRVFGLGALGMLVSGVVVETVETTGDAWGKSRWATLDALLTLT